jgi:quinol-cytochrome oxidoreductase complex cytochrome b subunit
LSAELNIGGDVAAASAALAGLILVYIGSVTASFSSFQPTEKRTVLASHRRRVWFAFVGFALFLSCVVLSLLGKWLAIGCMVIAGFILLVIAMVFLLATAILTVLEIK